MTLKNFPKKFRKMRFSNSVTVPKNVKGGTLRDFLTSIVLQNIETNQKFQKKWHSTEKSGAKEDP